MQKQVKVASPEESGRNVTHENVYFANGNYERRSLKLVDENANCWVVFERSYSYLRLLPAYSKIARTNVKVVKARLLALVQLRTREQAFNWVMNTELLRFKLTEAVATKQASVTTLHVNVVWAFLQK